MKLIKVIKLTGAKRLYRRYELENAKGLNPPFSFELTDNYIEFAKEFEDDFILEVEAFKAKQIEEQYKLARKENIVSVSDSTLEQGTKEWLQARAGIITASKTPFDINGDKIPTFDSYVDEKVAEKWAVERGLVVEDSYSSNAMSVGLQLEGLAIEKYEALTNNKVVQKGLVTANDFKIGASPDGVTTDENFNKINIEIKSVMLKNYIAQLDRDSQTKKYKAQMQVQMFILDVDITHFIVQCQEDTELPIVLREVERDEVYISNMVNTIKEYEVAFNERYNKLKEFANVV